MDASVKKYIKAAVNILIALAGLLLVIWLLPKAIVFFMPFVIGWIIACIASPPVRFFEEKMKIRRKAGSAFVIIVVIGLVILCMYLIGGKLVRESVSFVNDLPEMWKGLEKELDEIADNLSGVLQKLPVDLQDAWNHIEQQTSAFVMGMVSSAGSPTIAAVGNFAKSLPSIIIGVIMCLLSAYLFVAERKTVSEAVARIMPEFLLYRWRMIRRVAVKAVGGYFKAQIKIEIWIYLLLVIGLLILKVNYVLLVALVIAFLDFLPFFGTGTIMVPWAIIKFLSADYKMTIGLLIIWGVGQLVRQLIQPKIMGDSMGMPPLPTLFLLYIGYRVGGVVGMIIAVPIGIIVVELYKGGAFETTQNSIRILTAGLNRFRRLNDQDLAVIRFYKQECERDRKEREKREQEKREQEKREQEKREQEKRNEEL